MEEQNVKVKMVGLLQQVELSLDQQLSDCMEAKDRMAIPISKALLKDKVFKLRDNKWLTLIHNVKKIIKLISHIQLRKTKGRKFNSAFIRRIDQQYE
jgi:hypothetical protein